MITYYHVSGKKFYRSVKGFEQPVNKLEYSGPRFMMLPAEFKSYWM